MFPSNKNTTINQPLSLIPLLKQGSSKLLHLNAKQILDFPHQFNLEELSNLLFR